MRLTPVTRSKLLKQDGLAFGVQDEILRNLRKGHLKKQKGRAGSEATVARAQKQTPPPSLEGRGQRDGCKNDFTKTFLKRYKLKSNYGKF